MLYLLIGILVGTTAGYLFALQRGREGSVAAQAENARLLEERGRMQDEKKRLLEERERLLEETARMQKENVQMQAGIARLEATMEAERRAFAAAKEEEKERQRRESTERTAEMARLREEVRAMAAELATAQGAELRAQHSERLHALLDPLQQSIQQFKDQFVRSSAVTETHIKALAEQSHTLGQEAEALSKALRGNTKMQGNWGEQILERLLETSGLTAGRDYEVQAQRVTGEGQRLIPDVIVHLPEGRDLVIDSKVSLTAFAQLALTDDAQAIARLQREHLQSVMAHVKELSKKQYAQHLSQAVGYVLMFIPHEAAYLAALDADPELLTKAYREQVIIINPSNLFMALQLAYNLWQTERQSQSVADIYASAERLHSKFVNFAHNFVKIGEGIDRLRATFDEAQGQLSKGKGNIVRQLEGWREKGFTPSKELPLNSE